ncbi:MAG: hypothetical protein OXD31_04620 [Chloroflexi bacterium]|nr:hypothetical protein [Chloroflexota bacterium]
MSAEAWWIGLVVLALILFFMETQMPGMGVFGLGGAVCLVVGAFMLSGGNPAVVGGAAIISAGTLALTVKAIFEARRAGRYASPTDPKRLIGQIGTATTALNPRGSVLIAGEQWTALADSGKPVAVGERVIILEVEGLVLKVFKADED